MWPDNHGPFSLGVSTTANVPQATYFQVVSIVTNDIIHPGDIAYVVPESGEANRLREGAGLDKPIIPGGGIPLGRPMLIISGPTEVPGLDSKGAFMVNWWYVEALCKDGVRRQGYTAERNPKERSDVFLKPYRDCQDGGKRLLKTTLAPDGSGLAWLPLSAMPSVMQMLRDFDPVTLNTGAMVPGESLSVRFSYGKG